MVEREMLCDREIKELIKVREIKIEPFDEKKLGPVSYDLETETVENFRGIKKLVTKETIHISNKIAGLVSMRSRGALRRLFWSSSMLVDPGYTGKLLFLVWDPGLPNSDYPTHDLFQIMFFKVGEVGVPYDERKTSTAMNRTGFVEQPPDVIEE